MTGDGVFHHDPMTGGEVSRHFHGLQLGNIWSYHNCLVPDHVSNALLSSLRPLAISGF
jgi:hypothetical protein